MRNWKTGWKTGYSSLLDFWQYSVYFTYTLNNSAKNDILSTEAERFTPGDFSTFAEWRQTFSDHFPLSFVLDVKADTDVDFED